MHSLNLSQFSGMYIVYIIQCNWEIVSTYRLSYQYWELLNYRSHCEDRKLGFVHFYIRIVIVSIFYIIKCLYYSSLNLLTDWKKILRMTDLRRCKICRTPYISVYMLISWKSVYKRERTNIRKIEYYFIY